MSQSLSIEAEQAIRGLPDDLVHASENFHTKCLQHLAKAQRKGKNNWNTPPFDIPVIKADLDRAVAEGDWTSVANYAMILNHHGVTGKAPQEPEAHWAQSMAAGTVVGVY